ncbi:ODA11, partial [Symbiodinium sp. KB8]
SCRYNDTYCFDVTTYIWSNPVKTPASFAENGAHIGPKESGEEVPTPRGAHSAVVIRDQMLVFGGYGGSGFSRKDFNDLYSLNCQTWEWQKIKCKGQIPEPRSSHSAAVNEEQMLVFGGWNAQRQFSDIHVLNTNKRTWSSVDVSCLVLTPVDVDVVDTTMVVPRWSHKTVSVMAIPDWKVFLFGGCAGDLADTQAVQGAYQNDLAVLDTGTMRWKLPATEGVPPLPRGDMDVAYDAKGSRLVIFGGWANDWFNDVYTLDVGPPYAIMDMEPRMGPITGGTPVTLIGIDFVNTDDVVVRFSTKKGYEDVKGKFVSDTEITAVSPSFERLGVGEVDVRVSLNGDSFTTTFKKFTFFSVTDASKCLAFGPGILDGGLASRSCPVYFVIQARDAMNKPRTTGEDEFDVNVRTSTGQFVRTEITDNHDGTYVVSYAGREEGEYTVEVKFTGTFGGIPGPIRGSPFTARLERNVPKSHNKMSGPILAEHVKGDVRQLHKFVKKTLAGLRQQVPEEDRDTLLKVKSTLLSVAQKEPMVQLSVDKTQATVNWLVEREGLESGKVIEDVLQSCQDVWERVHRQVPITKNNIASLIKKHGAETRREITAYEARTLQYAESIRDAVFWQWSAGVDTARESLRAAKERQAEERKRCDQYEYLAKMFDYPEALAKTLEAMQRVDNELQWMKEVWDTADAVNSFVAISRETPWIDVDADFMEETAKKLLKEVNTSLNANIRWSSAYKGLQKKVKNFLSTCPLIQALHHPSLRPRHWKQLMEATKKEFTPPSEDPEILLEGVLQLNLHEYSADVEAITDQALKESKMEDSLKRLESAWSQVKWQTEDYKDSGFTILRLSEEDAEALDNDLLVVQGMAQSRFRSTFEEEITTWQKNLHAISSTVASMQTIQRTWAYLAPLFLHSDEVKRELAEDAERFQNIDKTTKDLISKGTSAPLLLPFANETGLKDKLTRCEEGLEQCRKSLADFLEGKRKMFPRFFFVSEADLLDILSKSPEPGKLQRHIPKLFLATSKLKLTDPEGKISAPETDIEEGIYFQEWVACVGEERRKVHEPIKLEGRVEEYLNDVHRCKVSSLTHDMVQSYYRYPTQSRIDWLMHASPVSDLEMKEILSTRTLSPDKFAASVIEQNKRALAGESLEGEELVKSEVALMKFTEEVELTMGRLRDGEKLAMKDLLARENKQLKDLIKLTRKKLSEVISSSPSSSCAFQWAAQLKARFVNSNAQIEVADANFPYAFEYLGNGPRLVITPLTDRIYVTATQALHLKMGCAPAGPAGTGKTETTKDLAAACGKACYVFNCSPEMDYRSMANVFKGLAASGSWGCFDEFNRLIPEVLSVCSVQFKAVCDAMRAEKAQVVIEGQEVALDHGAGVFITMNPGYLGRSELPEALKSLFRPVTVMVPDLVLICENMLMAEGFEEAQTLARKFYGLYSLLRELLSKQAHYDWGLRAVKSVLVVAGTFKHEILLRALRDFNLPKIAPEDEIVFQGLLEDLFPGMDGSSTIAALQTDMDPPRLANARFEETFHSSTVSAGLWPEEGFVLKGSQLEEVLGVRHCVFILGRAGCGKTQLWKTVADAKEAMKQPVEVRLINPKVLTPDELYGVMSLKSREWKEGLLSRCMREMGEDDSGSLKWIVLDGDLDPNWIESMNSVMDDNKVLTLANNERIPLRPNMRMLFEISNLTYATPATVSRAGIIYMSPAKGAEWKNIIASWVQKRNEPEAVILALSELLNTYVGPTLDYIKLHLQPAVSMEEMQMVVTLLRLLETLLPHEGQSPDNRYTPIEDLIEVSAQPLAWYPPLHGSVGEYRRPIPLRRLHAHH